MNNLAKYQRIDIYSVVEAYQAVDNREIKTVLRSLFPILDQRVDLLSDIMRSDYCVYSIDPSTYDKIKVAMLDESNRSEVKDSIRIELINKRFMSIKDIPIKLLKHLDKE